MKQISFVYEGNRYFTAFNCSDYVDRLLKQRKTNVLNMVDMGQTAVARRYAACNDGIDFGMMPIAELDKVIEDEGMFVGSGTFEWEGTTYAFNLSETGVQLFDDETAEGLAIETNEEVLVETVMTEEEPVVDEQETITVEEQEPEPVIEEEQPQEPEVVIEQEPEVPKSRFNGALDPNRKFTNRGCVLGTRSEAAPTINMRAGAGYKAVGCVFGSEFTSRRETEKQARKKLRAQTNALIQSKTLKVNPDVQASVPKKQTVNVPARTVPKWAEPVKEAPTIPKAPEGFKPAEEQPPIVIPKPPVAVAAPIPAATEYDPKAKARSNMSTEVAAIIGDIPLELLGNIPEYRNNPVDVDEVKQGGESYCKTASWHRAGSWYGIDVVNTLSRFICNFRRDVFISIPIQNCKEWLAAVKEKKNA